MLQCWQGFVENVCTLLILSTVVQKYSFISNKVPNKVIAKVAMFCSVMKSWVFGNGDGGLVVTPNYKCTFLSIAAVCEESY